MQNHFLLYASLFISNFLHQTIKYSPHRCFHFPLYLSYLNKYLSYCKVLRVKYNRTEASYDSIVSNIAHIKVIFQSWCFQKRGTRKQSPCMCKCRFLGYTFKENAEFAENGPKKFLYSRPSSPGHHSHSQTSALKAFSLLCNRLIWDLSAVSYQGEGC